MVALLKMSERFSCDDTLERRMFPRREINTCVEGRRIDHSIMARRNPRLSLELRDVSIGGLSALSETPLAQGERLSVFFPSSGRAPGWDACGRVIRCQPSAMGYRVAVEFDQLPAA